MSWYDPRTWFSTTEEEKAPEAPLSAPVGGPYGGKKKTRRNKSKSRGRRSRTGKKSSRS
jgi:hypothetical protein